MLTVLALIAISAAMIFVAITLTTLWISARKQAEQKMNKPEGDCD